MSPTCFEIIDNFGRKFEKYSEMLFNIKELECHQHVLK